MASAYTHSVKFAILLLFNDNNNNKKAIFAAKLEWHRMTKSVKLVNIGYNNDETKYRCAHARPIRLQIIIMAVCELRMDEPNRQKKKNNPKPFISIQLH